MERRPKKGSSNKIGKENPLTKYIQRKKTIVMEKYLLSATTSTASNSLQPYFLSYIPNKVAAVSTTTAQSKVIQV